MSFNIGLSGIRAASSDLNITGNNIANAGTVGFKGSRAEFGDVYAASILGSGSNAQGSGVLLGNVAQQFTQGNINYTENSLDLAVNGNGFFVTSNQGALSYTRAGYFGTDREGFITNNSGARLQGFAVNAVTGQINQGVQTDLRVDTRSADPRATTSVESTINLNSTNVRLPVWQQAYDQQIATAADPANPTPAEIQAAEDAAQATFDPTNSSTYNSSTSVNVFDSLGNPHTLTKYFVKTGGNEWDMFTLIDGRQVPGNQLPTDPGFAPQPTQLTFDTVGQLVTPQPLNNIAGWVPLDSSGQPTGADSPAAFDIDLTGTTQFASSFAVTAVVQDGFTTGELAGLSIDDEGLLVARYTNGQTRTQGQVVLANFANQQGLTPLGDTAWAQSSASGEPVVGAPQSGTLGAIQSGALEQSNVDLSEQLINLIIAQRNYQANAKTIQTEDAVTQTIINLR
ncbi:flagellar hook protein FlgE [Halopseudomonas laoshanensis]|uniref:Flagellar hook protein FlgE n=1 Tax=Halopseudomonas laoshanensis TaxID=2268758 RepID=A0A7V7GVB5_9GAMM|nr:flagellar hook protein FlgE [Halopseudomonas laoshanensis]KAA0696009.1 flagellar hook protein FlgE [Halopseudomonas laoshanensis]